MTIQTKNIQRDDLDNSIIRFQVYGEITGDDEIRVGSVQIVDSSDAPAADVVAAWLIANQAEAQAAVDAGLYSARFNQKTRGESARDLARPWFGDNPGAKQLYRLPPDDIDALIGSMVDDLGLSGASPQAISQLKLLLRTLAISSPPLAEAAGLLNRPDDEG